jgi:hypothetical protein
MPFLIAVAALFLALLVGTVIEFPRLCSEACGGLELSQARLVLSPRSCCRGLSPSCRALRSLYRLLLVSTPFAMALATGHSGSRPARAWRTALLSAFPAPVIARFSYSSRLGSLSSRLTVCAPVPKRQLIARRKFNQFVPFSPAPRSLMTGQGRQQVRTLEQEARWHNHSVWAGPDLRMTRTQP